MSYRETRDFQQRIAELDSVVDAAILSNDTRDITEKVNHIMARANDVRAGLERATAAGGEGAGEPRVDQRFLEAALSSTSRFIVDATKVELGSNPEEMHQRLLILKTGIDHADAYLRAALGTETV